MIELLNVSVCIKILNCIDLIFHWIGPVNVEVIECFPSSDQQPYWITETKESICIQIEFNSRRIRLVHHHGHHSFVLELQHGLRDVIRKRSIESTYDVNIGGTLSYCFISSCISQELERNARSITV